MGLIVKGRALLNQRLKWNRLGTIDSTVSSLDSALSVGERSYSTVSSRDNVVVAESKTGLNVLEIRFLLASDGDDADIDIWAAREDDDNLCRIATLDIIAGTQTNDDDTPKYFADEINVSNEGWITSLVSLEPGDNHIARLLLDTCGYYRFVFHGYGTFDSDCQVEISGY